MDIIKNQVLTKIDIECALFCQTSESMICLQVICERDCIGLNLRLSRPGRTSGSPRLRALCTSGPDRIGFGMWIPVYLVHCTTRSNFLIHAPRNTTENKFNWMSHRWGESFCRSVNRQQLSFHSYFSINWSRSKKSKNLTGVRLMDGLDAAN